MQNTVMLAGGGIGGMACALALARAGAAVEVFERAPLFEELGAGLQLGPNAVRVLASWGLMEHLQSCAVFPQALHVRDAHDGALLGRLHLGAAAVARYGQPYATLHRADLHALLRQAVQRQPNVRVRLNTPISAYQLTDAGVHAVSPQHEGAFIGQALIGCDGLRSGVRAQMLDAQMLQHSTHLAYRGMVASADLPQHLRAHTVTVWLGPGVHVVHYPIRAGQYFNVVVVMQTAPQDHQQAGASKHGGIDRAPATTTERSHASDLPMPHLGPVCADLQCMTQVVPSYTPWVLYDLPALRGPWAMAQGRVALLGDAAHAMRPYLAQGAAMALEDAYTLGSLVGRAGSAPDWPRLLADYAQRRWQRCARVQRQSARNGRIFHATGLLRWGRNAAMSLLGEQLLDNPWLYGGPPDPGS